MQIYSMEENAWDYFRFPGNVDAGQPREEPSWKIDWQYSRILVGRAPTSSTVNKGSWSSDTITDCQFSRGKSERRVNRAIECDPFAGSYRTFFPPFSPCGTSSFLVALSRCIRYARGRVRCAARR